MLGNSDSLLIQTPEIKEDIRTRVQNKHRMSSSEGVLCPTMCRQTGQGREVGTESQGSKLRESLEVPTLIHSCPQTPQDSSPALPPHTIPQLPGLMHAALQRLAVLRIKAGLPRALKPLRWPPAVSPMPAIPLLSSDLPLQGLVSLKEFARADPFAFNTVPILVSWMAFQPQV